MKRDITGYKGFVVCKIKEDVSFFEAGWPSKTQDTACAANLSAVKVGFVAKAKHPTTLRLE